MPHTRYRFIIRVLIILLASLLLLTGCYGKYDSLNLENPEDNLLTDNLVIWWNEGFASEMISIKKKLEERFEHTTFEIEPFFPSPPYLGAMHIQYPSLREMMKSDPSPDLIVFDTRILSMLIEAEYIDPIPDMYGLEMDADILTEFRSLAPDFDLYALPIGGIEEGVFYNKAIFDELQVPYPEDGMTWDEILELAESLHDGRYIPIEIYRPELLASQLSVRFYDPETDRVDFDTWEWELLTQTLLKMNDLISRNIISTFSQGKTAMFIGPWTFVLYYDSTLRFHGVDWEIAKFPVFDDERGLQPDSPVYAIGIPARSKKKEDAYKVMRYLLSYEVQSENSRKGLVSFRSDAEHFMDEFGQSTILSGKNVPSLFSDAPKGARDPIFEFISHMNHELGLLATATESERHTIVETVQRRLGQDIFTLMAQRQQLIDEVISMY